MKNLITLAFILCLPLSLAETKLEGRLTWSKLQKLESKMISWRKKATEEGIISIGKMRQRPGEIEIIRAYFPYLLPEKFFSYSIDMSCYPEFSAFRKERDLKKYNAWRSCLEILHRKSMPKLIKKALKDLRPQA